MNSDNFKKTSGSLEILPSPDQWPFFYGWVIVAVATVGILASIPGQTMGVGVFTDHLIENLKLTRVQLSLAYFFGTISSSFILPFAGVLLDRIGLRKMGVLSPIGLGLSVVALGYADRMAMVDRASTSIYFVIAVIFFCFLLIRFFGQGCMTMVSRVSIGKWFNHRRGLAAAISSVFVAFGFNASPQFLNWLVMTFGWREACLILAGLVGLIMPVLAWLFFREKPEQYGLMMDGVQDEAWRRKMEERVPDVYHEFTRAEALRDYTFWIFNLGVASQALIVTALTFHIADLGQHAGLDREASYSVFLPMAIFGVTANFIGGWLSDRIKLKWLLQATLLTQALGSLGLLNLSVPMGKYLMITSYGISGGLYGLLLTVTWPRFYGRKHLGEISGVNMSILVFASAIGPVFFSKLQQMTGVYSEVIFLSILMPLILMLGSIFAENPQEVLDPVYRKENSPE